jgi:polyribonucleotide nucleotidyltransferase
MQKKEYSIEVAGKKIVAEFTDLAEKANGSVILRCDDTVVLATACMSKKPKDSNFFPLTVDFEERFYAAGKILGSRFQKREGKPSENAILSGRIVDRTIRPLFDQYIRNEIQVVITCLSIGAYDPDTLSVIAASLALGVSNIPFNGPVSAVRICKKAGTPELAVNPDYAYRADENVEMDIVACGKDGNINMIETAAFEVNEGLVMEGLTLASQEIEKIQEFQKKVIAEIGKTKIIIPKPELPEAVKNLFAEKIEPNMFEHVFHGEPGSEKIEAYREEWMKIVEEAFPNAEEEFDLGLASELYEEKLNDLIHKEAIENGKRPDGRGFDDLRNIYAKAGGISSVLHGSGIFYRGQTHILAALTLGGPGDQQLIDEMESQATQKRFMLHYNFPPFSSGETGRMGGTNRRMIGHGALAEKALVAVLPKKEVFPYTIRLVSESMSSNGSTSMGSVCGGSLALMDGGVPIKCNVAGIASGLMMESPEKYKVLTDIQGPEDHHGDMDFKVAGTRNGITAIQMDVKVDGIPLKILAEALEKAKSARYRILNVMDAEIKEPRKDISPNAPKIVLIKIKQDQIGMVIGPGGKNINEIRLATGTEIEIEDDGTVFITGKNSGAEKAAEIITGMTKEFKKGEKCIGEVVKIVEFGAFVKIGPNTEALLHVSEIAPFRIDRVEKVLKIGDKIPVIVKEIDERDRLKLSLKDADPNFIKKPIQ